jgi:hypothetical protein
MGFAIICWGNCCGYGGGCFFSLHFLFIACGMSLALQHFACDLSLVAW